MLSFDFEWLEGSGVRGPELAATWATLEVKAGDSTVTRVLDRRAKTVRDFVVVPLYPLAEWLVTNWWFLTHEKENPLKAGDPRFRRRHALADNREGYALPCLEATPSGNRTRLGWEPDRPPSTTVEFLGGGQIWLDSREFRESCAALVDRVVGRLTTLGVDDTFLEQEWAAIQAADDEESKFCASAAGLGWDPYALDEAASAGLLELGQRLSDAVLEEAIPAFDPVALNEGCDAVLRAIADARSNALPLQRLRSFGQRVSGTHTVSAAPWVVGYDLARQLRRELDIEREPLPTTAALASALGESAENIDNVPTVASLPGATLIDGAVTHDDAGHPGFALRSVRDDNRRFLFCRALAPAMDWSGSDTLLTKARSEQQQRNRAFAAEFLVPADSLRERVPHAVVDGHDIDELAGTFGVSDWVIRHQLINHRIAQVW